MCMFSQRLQILVSPEQRRRLEEEAERRRLSVSGLIREAVDTHLGSVAAQDRAHALEAIAAMHGRFLPPSEIERLVEEERVGALRP